MNGGKIRTGFVFAAGTWLGGINYFKNLINAIQLLEDSRLVPVVIAGSHSHPETEFQGVEILKTPLLDRLSASWFTRKCLSRTLGQDILFKRFLLKHDIRVLSHSGHIGKQSSIATTGWIPDFQHIHLPEYFTQQECLKRDRLFKEFGRLCTRLIVSSHDALEDLRAFSPEHLAKADVLQFVAGKVPMERLPSLETLQSTYSFEGPYFHLPNQFWAHKNHRAVIDALRLLRDRRSNILVLCTGRTNDDRDPRFYPSLIEYAKQCEVLDSFRVLGPIPFADLIGLMHNAVALINPSKFEGWSTTVEESKTMGKQIILSNIGVHREQSPEFGIFFDPDNSQNLADLLVQVLNAFDKGIDMANQEQAASRLADRQRGFAGVFQRTVEKALEEIS